MQLVLPVYAAEPENSSQDAASQSETASLYIDNQNVYEGMTMPYKDGYQPICENGRVNLVLPLVSDAKLKNNRLTAAVDLGTVENSPFIFKTYVKDFTCRTENVNGTQETKEVFLISFEIGLNENRANGVYPIVIHVSGIGEDGQEVQKTFTNYVTITDGSSAADNSSMGGDGSNADSDGSADDAGSTFPGCGSTAESLLLQYNGSPVYELRAVLQSVAVQKEYSVTGIECRMIPGTLRKGT